MIQVPTCAQCGVVIGESEKQTYVDGRLWHLACWEKSMRRLRYLAIRVLSDGSLHCSMCKESRLRALEIDHVEGDGKQHREELQKSGQSIERWTVENPEAARRRLRVLCGSCHNVYGVKNPRTEAPDFNSPIFRKPDPLFRDDFLTAQEGYKWHADKVEWLETGLGIRTIGDISRDIAEAVDESLGKYLGCERLGVSASTVGEVIRRELIRLFKHEASLFAKKASDVSTPMTWAEMNEPPLSTPEWEEFRRKFLADFDELRRLIRGSEPSV